MKDKGLKSILLWFAAALVVVALFVLFLSSFSDTHRENELALLRDALLRGAVTCYAVEGRYPADLTYLEEHYAAAVDDTRYFVVYERNGNNLLPNIWVFERGRGA